MERTIRVTGKGKMNVKPDTIELNIFVSKAYPEYAEAMEAYAQDNTLANRSVQGNYNSLQLNPRSNTLTFGGDVTNVTITNYSRWI